MWTNECKPHGFLLVHWASSAEVLNPYLFASRKSNSLMKSLLTFRQSIPVIETTLENKLLWRYRDASFRHRHFEYMKPSTHSKFAPTWKEFYARCRAGCKDRTRSYSTVLQNALSGSSRSHVLWGAGKCLQASHPFPIPGAASDELIF